MKKIVIFTFCILWSATLFAENKLSKKQMISLLEHIWVHRQQYDRFKKDIKKIEKIILSYTDSYEIMWRAEEAIYYHATYLIKDKSEKKRIYELGIKCGRYAVKLNMNRPEGVYWLAVLYGKYADQINIFSAVKYVYKMKWGLEQTLKIDDRYQDGMAYLILGALYLEYPGKPFGFGNVETGIKYLKKAYKLNPECKAVYEYLALYYYKYKKNKKKALSLIEKGLSIPINKCCIIEEKTIFKELRELKKEILEHS